MGAQASVVTGNSATFVAGSFNNQPVTDVIVTGLSNVTGSFHYLPSAVGASVAYRHAYYGPDSIALSRQHIEGHIY